MDSGVGGLAVLHRLIEKIPDCPYVFLGDTAWMPYGEKPVEEIRGRVISLTQWLHHQYQIQAFVLACNTATVAAFNDLQAMGLPFPLLEPVRTTSEWVNQHIDRQKRKIGVLATPNTVAAGRYLDYLDSTWDILQVPCPGLASVIESGISSGPILMETLMPFITPLLDWEADVIILGCTHYSFIYPSLSSIVGPQVQLVDSADILAKMAIPSLQRLGLETGGKQTMMVTGKPEAFQTAIENLHLPLFREIAITSATIEDEIPLA